MKFGLSENDAGSSDLFEWLSMMVITPVGPMIIMDECKRSTSGGIWPAAARPRTLLISQ